MANSGGQYNKIIEDMDESVANFCPGGSGCKDIHYVLQIGSTVHPPL